MVDRLHPDEIKKQLSSDAQDFANHASNVLTIGVRVLLIAAIWLQLKGAERLGLLEKRWAEKRSA